jgi:hypothetical protein
MSHVARLPSPRSTTIAVMRAACVVGDAIQCGDVCLCDAKQVRGGARSIAANEIDDEVMCGSTDVAGRIWLAAWPGVHRAETHAELMCRRPNRSARRDPSNACLLFALHAPRRCARAPDCSSTHRRLVGTTHALILR